MKEFVQKFDGVVSLKDLGPIHYFLGLEVHRDDTGAYLSQLKYVLDLLKKLSMLEVNSCPTPMVFGKILSAHKGNPMKNPTLYRSIVGAI